MLRHPNAPTSTPTSVYDAVKRHEFLYNLPHNNVVPFFHKRVAIIT